MSKLNAEAMTTAKKNKSELIINHAVANVELFNNKPISLKYYFDENRLFLKFEVAARNGSTRTLKYFCYNENELEEVTSALAAKYNIPVSKETL